MKIQRGWKKGTDPAGCKRRSCKTSMCGDISRHIDWYLRQYNKIKGQEKTIKKEREEQTLEVSSTLELKSQN